jgi:predicted lipoprotein with Yx(FWY)xxD motif
MRSRKQGVPRRVLAVGASAAVAVLMLAACGSSSPTKLAAATTTTAPAPTTTQSQASIVAALAKVGPAAATGLTVSLAKSPKGIFLIGPNGRTLYIFTKDQGTVTACTTAACTSTWSALRASGTPTSGPGINAAEVGVAHGQVTYYGHLLYYFKGDTAPGATNGTVIPDWDLLGPFGNVMLPQA